MMFVVEVEDKEGDLSNSEIDIMVILERTCRILRTIISGASLRRRIMGEINSSAYYIGDEYGHKVRKI